MKLAKKIVATVDFSDSSVTALKFAAGLCQSVNGELSVVGVHNTVSYSPVSALGYIHQRFVEESRKLREKLEKIVSAVCDVKLNTKIFILLGIPEIEIQKFAERKKASLIVMGQSGAGKMKKLMLGSTVSHVINTSKIPVLVIPPDYPFKKLNHLVFMSDPDPLSLNFMRDAIDLAGHFKTKITVLFLDVSDKHWKKSQLSKIKKEIAETLNGNSLRNMSFSKHSATISINDYIDKHKADMAVLVKHNPGLIHILSTHLSLEALTDSFRIPVLVFNYKKVKL